MDDEILIIAFSQGYHSGHHDTVEGVFAWCEQGTRDRAEDWLEENSSGIYRPSAEAAQRLRELTQAVESALMHLNTNFDADGNSMAESDAADCLNSVMPNVTGEDEETK